MSLVQVAVSLPMFLLAIPAGALADIVDLRKLAGWHGNRDRGDFRARSRSSCGWTLPRLANLLLFTFLNGVLGVLQAPAWQAVVPQLVPPQSLQGAIAANSVGINISRAVGPALGGMILARLGLAVPFFVNAVSYLGMVGVLLCWHPPQRGRRHLPVEQFGSAIRTGFRHARNNPHLQATMIRGCRLFSVRHRLLGLASAHCARADRRGTGALRRDIGCHRSRRRGRRIRLALAGIETGRRLAGGGGNDRHGHRDGAVRGCARPGAGAFGKHHRRRRLDCWP